ncbi:hypothetical protein [Melioribacter roseus]|nr:hypothetical protein [Melioribacter roseus]
MSFDQIIEFFFVGIVSAVGFTGNFYQFVGNALKCRENNGKFFPLFK